MRIKGTKYPMVNELPNNAMAVSQYAAAKDMQVGHIYVKYERFASGYKNGNKGADPGYSIVCWQGINFVVPS